MGGSWDQGFGHWLTDLVLIRMGWYDQKRTLFQVKQISETLYFISAVAVF
jgi:hypothetical protein